MKQPKKPNSFKAVITAPDGKRMPNGSRFVESHPFTLKKHAKLWAAAAMWNLDKYYFTGSTLEIAAVYHRNPISPEEAAV